MEKHVMKKALFTLAAVLGLVLTVAPVNAQENREFRGGDFRMGIDWKEPPVVTPGEKPSDAPSDAIILFDGTNMDAWEGGKWDVADGVLTAHPGRLYLYQAEVRKLPASSRICLPSRHRS